MIKDIFRTGNKNGVKDFKKLMSTANPFYCNKNSLADKLWFSGGKKLKVKDMSDLHINNTVTYLKKNYSVANEEWVRVFEQEIKVRNTK